MNRTGIRRIKGAGLEKSVAGLPSARQKFDESRDDLVGRFFHQPMAGSADDDAFHIGCDEPGLPNEAIARSLFPREH